MTLTVRDPWDGTESLYASTVFQEDGAYKSQVLDSYGNPYSLKKEQTPVGFKLNKQKDNK